MAAFDTMENDLRALGIVDMAVAPVVVKPEPKEQNKPRPQIEQEKDIHIEPNHRKKLEALNIEETGHTRIVVDTLDPLAQQPCHAQYGDRHTCTSLHRRGVSGDKLINHA